MGRADYYAPGDWNAACFECGRKRKGSDLVKHWQGYWVCREHWEPRQAQDFVRAIPERPAPPFVQRQNDTFAEFCGPDDQTAIPNLAIPGCVKPGYLNPFNSVTGSH